MNKLSFLNWQGMPLQIRNPGMFPRKVNALVIGGQFIAFHPNNDPDLPLYIESAFTDLGSTCTLLADTDMGWSTMGTVSLMPYQIYLENWVSNHPDEAAIVTDVIFTNGFKDYASVGVLYDNITNCLNSTMSLFPGARIHTVFTGWGSFTETDFPDYYSTYTIQKERTLALGCDWIPIEALCHLSNDIVTPAPGDFSGSGTMNLTETGCAKFSKALADYIINGIIPERSEPVKAKFAAWAGMTTTDEYFSYVDVRQRVSHLYTNSITHLTFTITQSFTCDGSLHKIAYGFQYRNNYVFGHQNIDGKEWYTSTLGIIVTATDKIVLPVRIYIYQGDMYIALDSYTSGVADTYIVTDLYLGPLDMTCDTMMN